MLLLNFPSFMRLLHFLVNILISFLWFFLKSKKNKHRLSLISIYTICIFDFPTSSICWTTLYLIHLILFLYSIQYWRLPSILTVTGVPWVLVYSRWLKHQNQCSLILLALLFQPPGQDQQNCKRRLSLTTSVL